MSGIKGMNSWEKYYEANQQEIDNMLNRFTGRSEQVRQMSNKNIAKDLYEMILSGESDELILAEAAERLAVIETTNMNEARKN